MSSQSYTQCSIQLAVCSDGTQYQIQSQDANSTQFAQTVTRSGNTLPTVTFTDYEVDCGGFSPSCDTVTIDGTVIAENSVLLEINGSACGGNNGSFQDVQEVTVNLSDPCNFIADNTSGVV